ncbi:MAG: hypothetical protein KA744_16115, partial [Phenylobacterium sp.]|nr:hypothetical protein [Phenylobacterium sp.]
AEPAEARATAETPATSALRISREFLILVPPNASGALVRLSAAILADSRLERRSDRDQFLFKFNVAIDLG